MPAMRRYRVRQVREVTVTANNPINAAQIAEAAFDHGQDSSNNVARGKGPEGVWGNTNDRVRTVDIRCEEIG